MQQQVHMLHAACRFVRGLSDGTLLYDVALVDKEHNTQVQLRIALFNDEPISCENHATREQTAKVRVVVPVDGCVKLNADPNIERSRSN